MLQNFRATTFTFSKLLRENQHGGRGVGGGGVGGGVCKLSLINSNCSKRLCYENVIKMY